MEKKPSIWDELAHRQKAARELARKAMTLWNTLDQLPQEELVRIFRAICASNDDFDQCLHYRRRILGLLRDEYLAGLIGVSVPISLAWEFEKRFWVVEKEPPGPELKGGVDIQEIDDE